MIPITRIEKFLNGIIYGSSVPEPITRIEVMLNDIKNGDVVSLTPITRGEIYLAKISGANVEIPTPITREEMYLAKIAGLTIETPSPIVRIEHWLNDWAGGSDPLNTFTGAIVRFFSRFEKPVVKLEANFTPIQNLNGQDAPWPPGGGKNLLAPYASGTTKTQNGITGTANADGSITFSGTATGTFWGIGDSPDFLLKAGTYTLSQSEIAGVITNLVKRVGESTEVIISVSGSLTATFTTTEDYTVYFYNRVNSGTSFATPKTLWFQLESGSAATAWSPYSNICPISGHTGCEVVRTGKNLFGYSLPIHNGYWSSTSFVGDDSVVPLENATGWTNIRVPVPEGATITISGMQAQSGVYAAWLGSDNPTDVVSRFTNYSMNGTKTVPSGAKYLGLCFNALNTAYADYPNAQINIGSTASDYEAYSGTSVSISFGQTVYGGKLTVFEDGRGQIDADMAKTPLTDLTWSYQTQNKRFTASNLNGIAKGAASASEKGNILCSMFETVATNDTIPSSLYANGIAISVAANIQLKVSGVSTVSDLLALVANQTLVYELATPITIPLTNVHLPNTLVGENNVWVNAATGDITVQAYGTEIS